MARKKIQGITIEIGGTTDKLQNAIKGVEKKLKDTKYSLKDVNKLLKLDPGNVELLTQKQKLLTDSISGTEEKLVILKDAAKQAEAEMENGDEKQRAKYEALQREIIDTEQQLKSLTQEMKDFGSVSAQQLVAAGEKVKDFGNKMSNVGGALTKYVTGPIVAVGTAAVAAFNDVDSGLDIIVKKTGASGEALKDLEQRAKNLATSMPIDFTTAGNAVGEVNTRFGFTGDLLQEISGKFIRFAALNDTDVTSSIDGVQSVLAAFNIRGEKAGDVLDIINTVGQRTGVSVNKLLSDLASNATALKSMGYGAGEAAMFMGSLEKNGVNASEVIAGMRTALKNATKDGKSAGQAIREMQARIAGATSATEAMSIATEYFGSKAGPALGAALREGRLNLDVLASSVNDYAGSVDRTFEATLDPIDELKMTLNELKIVGMEVVQSAAPLIKSVLEGVGNIVSGIRTAWEGLSPVQQEAIIQAAGIAAAVGPVIMIGSKLISGIGTLMTMAPALVPLIGGIKAAAGSLFAFLAANPIVLLIAGIAALIAYLVHLWNTCEGFRDAVKNIWPSIIQGAQMFFKSIGGVFKSIGDIVGNALKSAWNWGADLIKNFTDGLVSMFNKPIEAIKWLASRIRAFIGFSEPEEGPLSNFHTFAPDMMKLFAQGIKDNERLVSDQLNRSLNIKPDYPVPNGGASGIVPTGAGTEITVPRGMDRPINVIFELEGVQQWVYKLNKAETQRVGVQLTSGGI